MLSSADSRTPSQRLLGFDQAQTPPDKASSRSLPRNRIRSPAPDASRVVSSPRQRVVCPKTVISRSYRKQSAQAEGAPAGPPRFARRQQPFQFLQVRDERCLVTSRPRRISSAVIAPSLATRTARFTPANPPDCVRTTVQSWHGDGTGGGNGRQGVHEPQRHSQQDMEDGAALLSTSCLSRTVYTWSGTAEREFRASTRPARCGNSCPDSVSDRP